MTCGQELAVTTAPFRLSLSCLLRFPRACPCSSLSVIAPYASPVSKPAPWPYNANPVRWETLPAPVLQAGCMGRSTAATGAGGGGRRGSAVQGRAVRGQAPTLHAAQAADHVGRKGPRCLPAATSALQGCCSNPTPYRALAPFTTNRQPPESVRVVRGRLLRPRPWRTCPCPRAPLACHWLERRWSCWSQVGGGRGRDWGRARVGGGG